MQGSSSGMAAHNHNDIVLLSMGSISINLSGPIDLNIVYMLIIPKLSLAFLSTL